jgi:hypothetical protein
MLHGVRLGLNFVALSLTSAPVLANRVWVVDSSGAGDFTQIQPAIDASVDRDTILINSGTYSGFNVDAKAVVVLENIGAIVHVNGQVTVQNIPTGKFVVLGGLDVTATNTPALRLLHNPGALRVESSTWFGYPEAVGAEFSPNVVFNGCGMTGRNGNPQYGTGEPGADALRLLGSRAALFDCTLQGGQGGDCTSNVYCPGDGGEGGSGCRVSGFLFASNTIFRGGEGGEGFGVDCVSCGGPGWGGAGGDGITWVSGGEVGEVLGCLMQGGPGGVGVCHYGCNCGGDSWGAGHPVYPAGGIHLLPGVPRQLEAPLIVHEASIVPLDFYGVYGDFVYLYLARQTDFQFSLSRQGVFIIPPSSPARVMGQSDSFGQLFSSVFFPELGEGVQSRVYFLQSVHRWGSHDRTLGPGRCLIVLDGAF